jgi:general stress protein 26
MTDDVHEVARVWERISNIAMCIFITEDMGKPRTRLMAAYVRPEESAIYLLTNKGSEKEGEAAGHPEVCLMFKGSGESYVAINGYAKLTNDRHKIAELWNTFAKAWWDGPDDSNIRLMKVIPEEAEIWDSPGRIESYVAMVAAAVMGTKPSLGENLKVKM